MGSGQSPVGSRVQQTHNCAEQHPWYGNSPRVYRPAGRQSSRWLCGQLSPVACGSNHNRPFKQPSSSTAGVNEVLDFIARGKSQNHGRRPSFLHSAFPQSWGHFRPPRAKLTVHEIQARLDAVRRQVLRQQVRGVLLAADRVESESSLGHLLLNPQRLQVNVSLFTQSQSLGDSPCCHRGAGAGPGVGPLQSLALALGSPGLVPLPSLTHGTPLRHSTSSSDFASKTTF